jgi:UDP-N-acetylglucosamine--N-acetylmuramyl-(pentapeptide) pyrophosphoryl-undecaprenol N-acetylglucosamine transferase
LTGGGTGGHVYPALEVGRLAVEAGDDVRYFGSLRGIEGEAAKEAGIPFEGVPANPIPRLASLEGLRSVLQLLKSARTVRRQFEKWRPDALLATGGYSSAPALRAARSLHIPIILHEQNTVPGRSTKTMASAARKICIVFEKTYEHFPKEKTVQTGMPIRRELVEAASNSSSSEFLTLIVGGSQGARALNAAVCELIQKVASDAWLHVAGPKLIDEVRATDLSMPAGYKLEAFLDTQSMASALSSADLAIARAGCGTIAEFAVFGLPAIFVPLPTSFANHQYYNAKEIEALGAATVLEQNDLSQLESPWRNWRADEARRNDAAAKLRAWAKPDAAERVLQVVKEAAG